MFDFPYKGTIVRTPNRFSTIAENPPKSLPGCYGIFDTNTGHWYVGKSKNIRGRRYDHEVHHSREEMLLHEAIVISNNIETFIFMPLYYLVPEPSLLTYAETHLIKSFNCVVPYGYNKYASCTEPSVWSRMHNATGIEKIAAYRSSNAHKEGTKKWLHTQEVTAKRNATLSDPQILAKRNDAIKAALNSDETKAKLREARARNTTPEITRKRSEGNKAAWIRRKALQNK